MVRSVHFSGLMGTSKMEDQPIAALTAMWKAIRLSSRGLGRFISGDPRDKRAEPRFETDGEASVRMLGSPQAKAIAARVVSTSRKGMRLTTPFIFPCQSVQVQLNARTVRGQVRYCRICPDGYQVGIRLR
jgi:hypothetical protein